VGVSAQLQTSFDTIKKRPGNPSIDK